LVGTVGGGSDIDGAAVKTLSASGQIITFVCDGSKYFSLSTNLDTDTVLSSSSDLTAMSSSATAMDISSDYLLVGDGSDSEAIKKQLIDRIVMPIGSVVPYAGSTTPTNKGWLLCDGSAVSRTTYAALFALISTTYGIGDGSTTFNLPDCTGRVVAGKESSETRLTTAESGINGGTLGATGGAESVTLTVSEIPGAANTEGLQNSGDNLREYLQSPSSSASSHNNTQPTIVLNYIIRAL
jgi:microcystin-dependent protein